MLKTGIGKVFASTIWKEHKSSGREAKVVLFGCQLTKEGNV
jgi:hypothetical protein